MKAVGALLVLLLCLSEAGAQGEAGPSHVEAASTPDIWTELNALRDTVNELGTMVVVQRESLTVVKGEVEEQKDAVRGLETTVAEQREALRGVEGELTVQSDHVMDLRVELGITQKEMERMTRENAEMAAKLSAGEKELEKLQARLSSSDANIQVLQTDLGTAEGQVQLLQGRQNTTEDQVQVLQSSVGTSEDQVQDLEVRLSSTDTNVEAVKKANEAQLAQLNKVERKLAVTEYKTQELWSKPQVVFSVALGSDTVGPFDKDTTLIYKRIITNVGRGYNSYSGIFTAPATGIYHFRFTAAVWGKKDERFYIQMYKNDQRLMYNQGFNNHGNMESFSNGLIVQLKQDDTVYMRIPKGEYRLNDSESNLTTWSGVLVYSW